MLVRQATLLLTSHSWLQSTADDWTRHPSSAVCLLLCNPAQATALIEMITTAQRSNKEGNTEVQKVVHKAGSQMSHIGSWES